MQRRFGISISSVRGGVEDKDFEKTYLKALRCRPSFPSS
jgi:hypothetical protein